MVVGSTGIEAATGPLVARVRALANRQEKARAAIGRIGEITLEGLQALRRADLSLVGDLMRENHALLNALGVGHPMLDAFVAAALPHSYGAKLTGAGGGGSMIALTDNAQRVVDAIQNRGGRAFVVATEPRGVLVGDEA